MGRFLGEHASPGDSIACVPIGAVGYYSGLTLYDMLGLTDRHIARLDVSLGGQWAGHEKHDGPYIVSRRPTYILLGNIRVLDEPRPPSDSAFFWNNAAIPEREREKDILESPDLQLYEPAVTPLANGKYLHYLKRKQK